MASSHPRRAPSVDLITLATPIEEFDEKLPNYQFTPSSRTPSSSTPTRQKLSSSLSSSSRAHFTQGPATPPRPSYVPARPYDPSPFARPSHGHVYSQSIHSRLPKYLRLARVLRPWIPMILYALTSVTFVVAFALYRTELFALLDELSLWLRSDEDYGHAVLFFLIFLTTIPPIPLYSTLIVLSGYTFGPWMGALISYFAALSGGLFVFIVSRALFRESIGQWLNSCTRIQRVVRAIEKRPKLLFLIRFAPYPYNVLNCLLAASPTLTLHTYTVCTALSLFKVIIHTSIGASIHSFKDFHVSDRETTTDESNTDWLTQMWSLGGIALCAVILIYLYIVARRAVDEELDDDPLEAQDTEETQSFLSAVDLESGVPDSSIEPRSSSSRGATREMVEIPYSPSGLVTPTTPYKPSFDLATSVPTSRQWP